MKRWGVESLQKVKRGWKGAWRVRERERESNRWSGVSAGEKEKKNCPGKRAMKEGRDDGGNCRRRKFTW